MRDIKPVLVVLLSARDMLRTLHCLCHTAHTHLMRFSSSFYRTCISRDIS